MCLSPCAREPSPRLGFVPSLLPSSDHRWKEHFPRGQEKAWKMKAAPPKCCDSAEASVTASLFSPSQLGHVRKHLRS
jgi:hypothetical protein